MSDPEQTNWFEMPHGMDRELAKYDQCESPGDCDHDHDCAIEYFRERELAELQVERDAAIARAEKAEAEVAAAMSLLSAATGRLADTGQFGGLMRLADPTMYEVMAALMADVDGIVRDTWGRPEIQHRLIDIAGKVGTPTERDLAMKDHWLPDVEAQGTHARWEASRDARMSDPRTQAGYAAAHSSYWADLNRRMEDPEFRDGYIETTREIQAFDARENAGGGPLRDHLRGQLMEAGTEAAEQWLATRANRRMTEANRRRLVGRIINALWDEIETAAIGIAEFIVTEKENEA